MAEILMGDNRVTCQCVCMTLAHRTCTVEQPLRPFPISYPPLFSAAGSISTLIFSYPIPFLDASSHLYKRVCPSVGLSVTRFFQWADFGRKWSEMPKKTVWRLENIVFRNILKCPKMATLDALLSKWTCLMAHGLLLVISDTHHNW